MSSLSDAFGTPATAELGGLLPPRQRPSREPRTETEAPAQLSPHEEPPVPPVAERPARAPEPAREPTAKPARPSARRKLRAAPAVARQSQTFQVPVYVLPQVKEVAEQQRKQDRGVTNAQIAFDAIDAQFKHLQQLLRARRVVERPGDSLFPARRVPRNRVAIGERRVLWAIQATADELKVLDDLIAELGAESRSDLISTAVEADLLPDARR